MLRPLLKAARKLHAAEQVELLELLRAASLEPWSRESPCRALRAEILREQNPGASGPPGTLTAGELLAHYAAEHFPGKLEKLLGGT